ncbi:hypothetical protein I302_104646 [Kwoniella bestiolae CBS 10118]|uniref:FAD dependent oxidoreductase domain-containing protein n=1 Tax=Kwoniella bestiolae CBS 10118 TaxID=1296100 RepID=A0A1B9GBV1_9TREE|nr:hypothetical protein I302_03356 [Kwoniella bestiolae CBS 10118]OCF28497.1 hypothetical protein I302_03356 [Kwoniella bestiolae CBS 10118]
MHVKDIQGSLPPVGDEGTGSSSELEKQIPRTGRPLEEGMCLSLWLQTVRNNPLLNHRTTEALPKSADVVIIGSGATGSLTALSLLQSPNPPKSVVLLEARELCSGATGRNAGHCKPDQWRGFTKYETAFGAEQALKILANEQKTWEGLVDYVRKNKVDCDLWVGKTLDVLMTDEVAEVAAKTFSDYKAAGGDVSKIEVTTDHCKAEKISRLKGAKAVYAWDASSLHPWKLVAHINKQSLDLGLNLQTWTPVTNVSGSANDWTVHTGRGDISTPVVIHATNAYAGALLPETRGAIRPCPHMCDRVLPPSTFAGSKSLKNSYAIIYPNGMYTINARPTSDGILLFGGAAPNQSKLLEYVAKDQRRRIDDSLTNFEPVTEAVRKLGTEGFDWDEPKQGSKVLYDYAWSGIIGRSADQVPFIGGVPGKQGQWMCCGHNGHGMARIFTAAPALAKLVQGATWAEVGLPDCFEVTQKRLQKHLDPGWNLSEDN